MAHGPVLPHYKACDAEPSIEPLSSSDNAGLGTKSDNASEPTRRKGNTSILLRRVLADLEVTQKVFGFSHCKVAEAWNALGLVQLHMEHDAEQALMCHEQALRIFQEQDVSLDCAITMHDIAHCYEHEQIQQNERALELYHEAHGLMKEHGMSENHPHMLSTLRAVSRLSRG